MDLKQLVMLAFQISIMSTVFGYGLEASPGDLSYLVRRPGLLARSLLAVLVIMPVVAVALVRTLDFPATVGIVLVALSISPMPPLLPRKQVKAGGNTSFGLSLLAMLALVSIVTVPVSLEALERFIGRPFAMAFGAVAGVVLKGVLGPLAMGLLVRAALPTFAERLRKPLALVAKVLLSLAAVVLLVRTLPVIWNLVGDGTVVAIVVFIVAGFAIGHLLGGPDPDHSVVLGLSAACRHPAIALAIAAANFPDERFGGTILLYLLVSAIVGIPYLRSQRRRVARSEDESFA
jgi:BASS family bile acid:Na+ symporter